MCITPKFWEALCEGVGRPDLPADARFRGYKERLVNRDALAEILDKEFARATTVEWMERLAGTVPVAPVLTLQQAIDNPYFHATGGVLGLGHPTKNDFRMISSPIRVDGEARRRPACGCTRRGSDAILAESGIGPAEIEALRADGAI